MISTHPGAKAFEHALRHMADAIGPRLRGNPLYAGMTADALLRAYEHTPPDQVLTRPGGGEYLHRWHVTPRGEGPAVYLHRFLGDDPDPRCHTHPFASISIILRGSYREHTRHRHNSGHFGPETVTVRTEGDVIFRDTRDAHRIKMFHGIPVTTLFFTGFRTEPWGFVDIDGDRITYFKESEQ